MRWAIPFAAPPLNTSATLGRFCCACPKIEVCGNVAPIITSKDKRECRGEWTLNIQKTLGVWLVELNRNQTLSSGEAAFSTKVSTLQKYRLFDPKSRGFVYNYRRLSESKSGFERPIYTKIWILPCWGTLQRFHQWCPWAGYVGCVQCL